MFLITRPQDQGQKTQKALQEIGVECLLEPLMEIRPVAFLPPDMTTLGAIVITSAQALKALDTLNVENSVNLYCVGHETSQELAQKGFHNIFMSPLGAQDLCSVIEKNQAPQQGKILYLSGADISIPLDTILKDNGYHVTRLICYEAHLKSEFSGEVAKMIQQKQISGVLLYSKRTAEHFMQLIHHIGSVDALQNMDAYTLSPSILSPESRQLFNCVMSPEVPQEGDLIELIKLNNKKVA